MVGGTGRPAYTLDPAPGQADTSDTMHVRVLLCDTPDGLAQVQYVLLRSGAALEIETATDCLRRWRSPRASIRTSWC